MTDLLGGNRWFSPPARVTYLGTQCRVKYKKAYSWLGSRWQLPDSGSEIKDT